MSSREPPGTHKCPFDGCGYVPKSTAISQAQALAGHIQKSHSESTRIWYGGGKVLIHRDVKSNTFSCPCGAYSASTSVSIQRHAQQAHKNMPVRASKPAAADDEETYRVVDPNPKDTLDIGGGEVWVPTGPTVVHKAYPLVAMTPMGPPEKSISVRPGASRSVSSSSKAASSSKATFKPIALTSASVAGPSSSTARTVSVSSKRKAEEPAPGPSKVRRVDNARSVSASASASTSKAVAGPFKTITHVAAPKPLFPPASAPSKTKTNAVVSSASGSTSSSKRTADGGMPLSAKVQRVSSSGWSTHAERMAANAAKPAPGPRPILFTKDTVKKKARDEPPAPVLAPAPVATSAQPTLASGAPTPSPAKGRPKPRPVVKPGTLAKTSTSVPTPVKPQTQTHPPPQPAAAQPSPNAKKHKHLRPTLAAGVAASSASSGYSTSTRASPSSMSSARNTPLVAPVSLLTPSAPAPGRSSLGMGMGMRISAKCSECGGWRDPYGQNGKCTMCYVESLPAAPPPRCATCGDKAADVGDKCTPCHLKAVFFKSLDKGNNGGSATADQKASGSGGAAQVAQVQKPRKKRVTKKMRQREFERWFAQWTVAHRARRASRPRKRPSAAREEEEEEAGEEEKDKTDWWRVESTRKQGGVSYSTPEAFFAALEDALRRHREEAAIAKEKKEKEKVEREKEKEKKEKAKSKSKEKGKGKEMEKAEAGAGSVLTFFGGYSIVAQPKISAIARLDKLVARMEEIGFRLDSTLQGYVKFQYKSARGLMDEVYKYPCSCGGAPPRVAENELRHAHRIPDAKHAGEVCGGTIMLMVGEDNARLAYGIQGQRIAVDIVH